MRISPACPDPGRPDSDAIAGQCLARGEGLLAVQRSLQGLQQCNDLLAKNGAGN